jgi:hypothetical protein
MKSLPHGSRTLPAPSGYSQYVHDSTQQNPGKCYIHCINTIEDSTGRKFQCQQEFRKDRLPKDPAELEKYLRHKCFNQSLDRFMQRKKEIPILPKNSLRSALLNVAGKENLSLYTAAGKPLHDLILKSIIIGQQNPDVDPETLFPPYSRKTLTAEFIQMGQKLYLKFLKQYLFHKNIALSIDAGKLGSSSYFDILITNAFLNLPINLQSDQSF